jgi:hypothetical protein
MFGISTCLLVYSTSTTHTLGKRLGLIFIPPITRSAKEQQQQITNNYKRSLIYGIKYVSFEMP